MVRSLFFTFIISLMLILPVRAEESGYFGEIQGAGRPPSAFSLCCCKKTHENKLNKFYSCNLVDDTNCPDKTQKYDVQGVNCPNSLMFSS